MKLTYEELEAKLRDTEARLQRTEELLKAALEEIAKLKERLNRNSKNSSKPPSTDQKCNTADGQRSPRCSRVGKTRAVFPSDKIDRHVQCSQENCPHCGSSKIRLNGQPSEVLQQAELPEIRATVTEYQLQKYSCEECGKNSTAPLPGGVPDSAFGPKLMGLLATLTGVLHVAKREALQLIKDLYGVDMGVGSVPNVEKRVAAALDSVYDRIHQFVIRHKFCTHFNELRLSCKIHREYREGTISIIQRNRRLGVRRRRVEYWLEDGLANGSDALSKICAVLLDDFEKLWTFTRIAGMEPTNNMAERDLRKLVVWRRKSYGTRSDRGKKFVERITTVAQTIRKQSGNVLHFVQQAIECFYAQTLPPLISEAMSF